MRTFKSITFRLYAILSIFLIGFICFLIYIQIFVVGRSYMITQYSQQRITELSCQVDNVINNCYSQRYHYTKDSDAIVSGSMQEFEGKNNAFLLYVDNDFTTKVCSEYTMKELGRENISYIENYIMKSRLAKTEPVTMRVFDRLGIPTKYIAVSMPMQLSEYDTRYMVIIFEEVFTDKSSVMIRKYIFYILAASVALILVITAIFSYVITRPIIKINRTASRMIEMDFTAKCSINSTDEIGKLAGSLNFLSDKLNSTIKKLKESNQKLRNDLDLRNELDIQRKDFIASVSHEFKTPMTIIKGYVEGINDDVMTPDEKNEGLNIIISEIDKMDKLVKDLLELSFMESSRCSLNLSEFAIEGLLKSIVNKYSYMMQEKNIMFVSNINCKGCIVNADEVKIEQVVTNFLNNAIINTKPGHKIVLQAEKKENLVYISVENEGIHIGEKDLKRIWEKFYRADKSRSKKSGGTGLGLSISKTVLELHKSSYGVKNVDGGVKFYFTLNTK